MEVKFNFNIEICHFQNELQSFRCLNTFWEDYSGWNSFGRYSPRLKKFSLASALPISAKQGWNSISVILPLRLHAEESDVHFQICRNHLAIKDLWDPKACETHGSLAMCEMGEELGAQKHHSSPVPVSSIRMMFPTHSLLFSPPELARQWLRQLWLLDWTGLTLCFRFTNNWNKIWWNLRKQTDF